MVSFDFLSLIHTLQHYVGMALLGFWLFKVEDLVGFPSLRRDYSVWESGLAQFTVYDGPLVRAGRGRCPGLSLAVQPFVQALHMNDAHGAHAETRSDQWVVCLKLVLAQADTTDLRCLWAFLRFLAFWRLFYTAWPDVYLKLSSICIELFIPSVLILSPQLHLAFSLSSVQASVLLCFLAWFMNLSHFVGDSAELHDLAHLKRVPIGMLIVNVLLRLQSHFLQVKLL